MNGNFQLPNLQMLKNDFGWGVYTNQFIPKGTLIERAIMMRLVNTDGNENPHLFTWSNDRKTWCAGSGLTPFYNHSDTPNILKKGDLTNDVLEIYASKDIQIGEEILGTYSSKRWRSCFKDF